MVNEKHGAKGLDFCDGATYGGGYVSSQSNKEK